MSSLSSNLFQSNLLLYSRNPLLFDKYLILKVRNCLLFHSSLYYIDALASYSQWSKVYELLIIKSSIAQPFFSKSVDSSKWNLLLDVLVTSPSTLSTLYLQFSLRLLSPEQLPLLLVFPLAYALTNSLPQVLQDHHPPQVVMYHLFCKDTNQLH